MLNVLNCVPASVAARLGSAVFDDRTVMDAGVFGPERMVVRPEPSVVDLVHETYSAIELGNGRFGFPALGNSPLTDCGAGC